MNYTPEQVSQAMELYPATWVLKHKIKNESGMPIEFKSRFFLYDIYNDLSPVQAILKAPQIGLSVLQIIKSLWVAKKLGKDIIYTLPTQSDVVDMAGGKINRLVAQNPILQEWVADRDTVEQKQVGENIIYYRGTFVNKAAMMVSSQLNIHDEVDASKQDVIEQYETRLQAQAGGWRWYFSHPSAPGVGVDRQWEVSDQKHWFIRCPSCNHKQYLSWPESVDIEAKTFNCKACRKVLSEADRRRGEWVRKYRDRDVSGYWISQLMCPWITAEKIVKDFNEKTPEYFYNYVLGLPFTGGGNKLTREALLQNLRKGDYPENQARIVIGIDTGRKIDVIAGSITGLFFHGDFDDYNDLDRMMKRWPNAIAIIDAGGDQIGARKFFERWRGRVFMVFLRNETKTKELVQWKDGDEYGVAIADRERCIQMVVDEFRDRKIPILGTEEDWFEAPEGQNSYFDDWNALTRIKQYDSVTGAFKGIKWVRNGRDHRALATVFWRIGMSKFGGGKAMIFKNEDVSFKESPTIDFDNTVPGPSIKDLLPQEPDHDWRN